MIHSRLVHLWRQVARAFQSVPNLLPWCAGVHVILWGGVTLYTPHVPKCPREVLGGGPAGQVTLCSLSGSSVHTRAQL